MRLVRLLGATAAGAASPTHHILCLHGGGTNAAIMRMQTAKLRHQLRDVAEFHYLEGGMATPALDEAIASRFDSPFYAWYDVTHDGPPGRAHYVERCLLDRSVEFRYAGVDAALDRLELHISEATARGTPYDAVLGFSQGAVLLTLLTALRLHRGEPPQWRLNVCIAGMPCRADRFRDICGPEAPPIDFPCVQAHGAEDPFHPWGAKLAGCYVAPDLVEHPEGHRFPHSMPHARALGESIRRRLQGCVLGKEG